MALLCRQRPRLDGEEVTPELLGRLLRLRQNFDESMNNKRTMEIVWQLKQMLTPEEKVSPREARGLTRAQCAPTPAERWRCCRTLRDWSQIHFE